ncbi:hypothetical protein RB2150_15301 [Rhodobacteraceae bacterium HTCC2150]|nr:hypothetical protein RB2150_15301 [Rhodobacteraceae bacterium HTCC2150]
MSLWILITICAAFLQNLRFMLQKQVKSLGLTALGATFARFVFSMPVILVLAFTYLNVSGAAFPKIETQFWPYAMVGGIAQILATVFVVALFSERNFAVGMTFKKTEVMLTALIGFILLGEGVSGIGFISIAVGFIGVLLLSDPPKPDPKRKLWERIFNKASIFGVSSGVFFAISAVSYRAATLSVGSGDFILRAALSLAFVTCFQTVVMAIWMSVRARPEMGLVIRSWRITGLVGILGMGGSLCWFMAFTLQNAAYVFTLGQVELIFAFVASYFYFKEQPTPREVLGALVIVISVVVLMFSL